MKYIDMAKDVEKSLEIGLKCIVNNTLPSFWEKEGVGWHEQWMNADYSGVYAACEGIILLSQTQKHFNYIQIKELLCNVYKHNLCIVFDEKIEINNNDNFFSNKKNQREKALNATFKLSKFLWASSYMETSDRNFTLENAVINKLLSMFDSQSGFFKCTKSSEKGSVLATAFAYIALSRLGKQKELLYKIENVFLEYIDNIKEITQMNIDDIVFIIWSISQNINEANKDLVKKCSSYLSVLLNNTEIKNNLIVEERYNIKSAGIRDNFSINKYFILIQAIEAFIIAKKFDAQNIKHVVSEINSISSLIMKNEVYSRNKERKNVLFWENYYALQILNDFLLISNKYIDMEDKFMIITPKYFSDKNFTVDKNLCVVIMPFKTDWSNDMYEIYKESAEGFKVWRSDEEYRDDVIIQTVWEKINEASFVIADCTEKNPNVFYELGIAHTLGKPVFMCSQSRSDFPFDITHIRSFQYGLKPGEIRKLKSEIKEFITRL